MWIFIFRMKVAGLLTKPIILFKLKLKTSILLLICWQISTKNYDIFKISNHTYWVSFLIICFYYFNKPYITNSIEKFLRNTRFSCIFFITRILCLFYIFCYLFDKTNSWYSWDIRHLSIFLVFMYNLYSYNDSEWFKRQKVKFMIF